VSDVSGAPFSMMADNEQALEIQRAQQQARDE
jgi:hypothetical protein